VIESRFGESTPWSLGVEEELMLVDAETFELVPAVSEILRRADGLALPGELKTELFAGVVELATDLSPTADEALRKVTALRRAASTVAAGLGVGLLAAGAHPLARPEEQEIVPEPRYREMVEYAGLTARRQGVNGLHVHVGMPSAAACMHALEGVLPWLPVVLALSANSPFLAGAETGFASNRAIVLAELPRSGAPPHFPSYADWERHVERLAALGLPRDYTALWWDVRPHPRLGTLEIRIADQPTALELTGALVSLLQALCVAVLEQPPPDLIPGARGIYQQNRWAAARFGLRAELIDVRAERRAPASELARELLELVAPVSERLGSAALLRLDPDRSEAERQLEAGVEEASRDLVRRSLASV